MVLLRSDGTPTYMLAVVVVTICRHGRRPCDPRRRPSQQRRAAIAADRGDGRGHSGLWPFAVDQRGLEIGAVFGLLARWRSRLIATCAISLPETMRNYLLRLGWRRGDDEIISTEQAIRYGSISSPSAKARADGLALKLDNLNGHYIRNTADETAGGGNHRLPGASETPAAVSSMTAAPAAGGGDALARRSAPRPWSNLFRVQNFCSRTDPAVWMRRPKNCSPPKAAPPVAAALPALAATDWTTAATGSRRPRHGGSGRPPSWARWPSRCAALTGKAQFAAIVRDVGAARPGS